MFCQMCVVFCPFWSIHFDLCYETSIADCDSITRFNWIPICFPLFHVPCLCGFDLWQILSEFFRSWSFWPLSVELACFLDYYSITTCWSLIWNSLLIANDSFQLLFFIHLSSLTLVAFLTWFCYSFWPIRFVPCLFLLSITGPVSCLQFLKLTFVDYLVEFVPFFFLYSSHYLAVTDLRLLADCRWLVFHQLFFVDVSCIFDLVFITFWPIRFDDRSVSLCP